MCLNVFHFFIFYFKGITIFPKRQPFLFEKQRLFIQIIFLFYNIFFSFFITFFVFYFYFIFLNCFLLFIFFIIFFFHFFHFFLFFVFPYFRGNSLNSRADLEFKEIRLFSTMIFQKYLKFSVFSKNPNVFSFSMMNFRKNTLNFNYFLKNHRGKKVEFP